MASSPKLSLRPTGAKVDLKALGGFKVSAQPADLGRAQAAGCGHDHGHAHNHGHAHDHAPARPPRAPTFEPAADGRPAVQLRLDDVLPGETDEAGRFAELRRNLLRTPGLLGVAVRAGAERELEVVYDPAVYSPEGLVPVLERVCKQTALQFRLKTWFVVGMDSPQCGELIEHALSRMEGVLTGEVAYAAERLVVEYDAELTSERAIEKRVSAIGYSLEEPSAGHACSMHAHGGGLSPRSASALVAISGASIAVGLGLEWSGLVAPGWPLNGLYVLALLTGGYQATRGAIGALRAGKADIESLMVLAAVGAAALGAWFEGAFLLFLFSFGHALEHRATDRARTAVEALARLRPETARVRRGGDIVEVPVAEVSPGATLVVRPGDRIALDGVVKDGQSSVDQSAVTGESVPVPKSMGETVYAGTVNQEGTLEVGVTRAASSSTLARLVDLVTAAEARKGPAQRFATRVERIFVPIVLVGAPLFTLGLMATGHPLQDSVLRGLSLLVAASPCALAISTPAAVLSAVARAARGGVLVKGGTHLDALGKLRVVAFDKTGTLTENKPTVQGVVPAPGVSEARLLATAAAAEGLSGHPLARAVVAAAAARGLPVGHAEDLVALHGKGLRAVVDGVPVWIGNPALFQAEAAAPPPPPVVLAALEAEQRAGRTAMIVAAGVEVLGVIGVADTLRGEAADTVRALQGLGIRRVVMLSGDHEIVARSVAAKVGIDDVRAPLLPEEKLLAVRELARSGGVAMVGDGVNDAPALATATVGISLGGAGSDVALETADVVLMADNLSRLPFAVSLAQATRRVVRQNLSIAIGVSALLVLASVMGWVEISEAVVLHEGSTLVVVFNGLRLLRWREG